MEKKLNNKEKVLKYLQEIKQKVSRDELVQKTGISSSNFSKLLKKLEEEKKIIREYQQVGGSKFLFISLNTNSVTNSISQETISTKKLKSIEEKKGESQIQNTISNRTFTNSIQEKTNSIQEKTNSIPKSEETEQKYQRQPVKDQKLANFIRTISGQLVIAMNYAINSIKNKPEVVAEKQDATRYNYFKNWNQYREFFKKLEEESKKEVNFLKEVI